MTGQLIPPLKIIFKMIILKSKYVLSMSFMKSRLYGYLNT